MMDYWNFLPFESALHLVVFHSTVIVRMVYLNIYRKILDQPKLENEFSHEYKTILKFVLKITRNMETANWAAIMSELIFIGSLHPVIGLSQDRFLNQMTERLERMFTICTLILVPGSFHWVDALSHDELTLLPRMKSVLKPFIPRQATIVPLGYWMPQDYMFLCNLDISVSEDTS